MPDEPTPSDRARSARPQDTCALVVGVANKRSIAWAITERLARSGTRLVLTYADERLGENVRELAASLTESVGADPRPAVPKPTAKAGVGPRPDTPALDEINRIDCTPAVVGGPLILPCDVTRDSDIADVYETIAARVGRLDYLVHAVAFAPRTELSGRFVDTTRDGFRVALDVSVFSLIALTRGAVPLMRAAGGGSVLTLSYLGAQRVFPNYNVMGVAKAGLEASMRYLAADLGPDNVRVNAISAGPLRTLASAGISGFSQILQVYRDRSALKRNIDARDVADAAYFLLAQGGGVTGQTLVVDAGFNIMGM